ncbi:MAG: DUF2203 family protein [Calditrichaeota bacterium]|nr:DUF2203 family protein [Calditrichota bacterium]
MSDPLNPQDDAQEFEPRIFSLEDANALIPQMAAWIGDIRRLRDALIEIVESKVPLSRGNGHAVSNVEKTTEDMRIVSENSDLIRHTIKQIAATGAVLKDIDEGLVDFLHEREGRLVFLCWKLGETEIGHYHETDTGYSGRKPV